MREIGFVIGAFVGLAISLYLFYWVGKVVIRMGVVKDWKSFFWNDNWPRPVKVLQAICLVIGVILAVVLHISAISAGVAALDDPELYQRTRLATALQEVSVGVVIFGLPASYRPRTPQ